MGEGKEGESKGERERCHFLLSFRFVKGSIFLPESLSCGGVLAKGKGTGGMS